MLAFDVPFDLRVDQMMDKGADHQRRRDQCERDGKCDQRIERLATVESHGDHCLANARA